MTQRVASLAVALNQNTAPVDEYRCLYTHDVFKKQKKWHDGSLRFHTFNARVMVYDDARNYIGDLHYRQDEPFGEGTEIQLDRGVRVDVCEPLGQTQTDLAPLLNRSRMEQNGTISQQTPATRRAALASRPINVASQGRAKSLAELLGPSQGQLGRAQLPVQSPFGQRQSLLDRQDGEPSPKRRKVVVGKENAPLEKVSQAQVATKKTSTLSNPTKQRPLSAPRHVTASEPALDVIDLLSDNEDTVSPARARTTGATSKHKEAILSDTSQKPRNTGRHNQIQMNTTDKCSVETTIKPAELERTETPQSTSTHEIRGDTSSKQVTSNRKKRLQQRSNESAVSACSSGPLKANASLKRATASDSASCNIGHPKTTTLKAGVTRLMLSQTRNVKKLLYKVLLPSSAVSPPPPEERLISLEPSQEDVELSVTTPKRGSDTSALFSSPLFEPEASHQALRPDRPALSETAFDIPEFAAKLDDPVRRSTLEVADSDLPAEDDHLVAEQESRVPSVLSQIDQELMAKPKPAIMLEPTSMTKKSPIKRSFRRVVSESDSHSKDVPQQAILAKGIPTVLQSIQAKVAISVAAPDPPRLQRSASDTAFLEVADESNIIVRPSKQVEEEGPWTSFEGFLLFDWWPTGLEKPDYVQYPVVGRATIGP